MELNILHSGHKYLFRQVNPKNQRAKHLKVAKVTKAHGYTKTTESAVNMDALQYLDVATCQITKKLV